MDNKLKKIKSVIYGMTVGDALGVPVEFKERDTFKIEDMIGYGTYNQPEGTWSDDTSLTLALIEHLYQGTGISGLMNKFVMYRKGYLTPFGKCFDIGIATNNAIDRYLNGMSPEECGGTEEYDNGNGALMRISPLAFLDYDVEIIEKYTKVTHRHPRSIVASILYIHILKGILEKDKNFNEVLKDTKKYFENTFKENLEYFKEYEMNYKKVFEESFINKSREEISSTGYVVSTFEACIWCIGNSKSYEEAVLKAVNLGEDTDTIAAITGTLAGAIYGIDSIPYKWINSIKNKELIDSKCEELYKTVEE